MALAVASTVVLVRILAENNDLHTQAGHIAVGWLVVEDLFTVVALVLLPALFGRSAGDGPIWMALGFTALKVTALVAFTAVVGTRVIPRMLDYVASTRSRELFTLTVLVIAPGIAVGSSLIFSVSMALGAFLAGMVVGRSDYSLRAASEALPMRDAFAVLFFVSVGMLLDPEADRALGGGSAAPVGARQPRRAGAGRSRAVSGGPDGRSQPPGRRGRLWPHGPDRRAAAPRQRHCPHRGGAQHGRRTEPPAGGHRGDLEGAGANAQCLMPNA
jgi:hypothetical protein